MGWRNLACGALWSVAAGCGQVDEVTLVACDPVADTGCGPAEHCRIGGEGATRCLEPETAIDSVCTVGSCPPTEACVRVEGYLACRSLCRADGSVCSDGSPCGFELGGGYGVCVGPCDLFPDADAVPCPGGTCTLFEGIAFPICAAAGLQPLGATCAPERCAAGLACLRAESGELRCHALCPAGDDGRCPEALTCGGEIPGVLPTLQVQHCRTPP